jgi:Carboxypeptidase regulatory-like domain
MYLVFSILLLVVSLPCLFGQSAAQITGVVLDPAGGFVSDASVSLFSLEKVREARTASRGQFAFVDLPPGSYELQVKHAGFKTVSDASIRVTGTPVPQISITLQLGFADCGDPQLTVSYPERSGKVNLVGTVKDFSTGFVKNATLTLVLLESGRGQAAKTNENGEFQFTNLTPGKYTLKVTHEDYSERSGIDFWIARENVTTLTPIYIFRKDDHGVIICQ